MGLDLVIERGDPFPHVPVLPLSGNKVGGLSKHFGEGLSRVLLGEWFYSGSFMPSAWGGKENIIAEYSTDVECLGNGTWENAVCSGHPRSCPDVSEGVSRPLVQGELELWCL